ncbi:transglycosylase SLT domain-containing protein [Porticoccus sp. W117]|uniref:transglycosylase SLT domain-containing protein n=1 Tax=Porticoccus sp. W117 TaxID=3054777 RepID=UPI0025945473|nr:transglycosylase SLT domain-containing protein [Porticoccus sp. W117]MDM3870331.1 transglycosylase SLT domain-containing protein [Porticoccus sp. W117]
MKRCTLFAALFSFSCHLLAATDSADSTASAIVINPSQIASGDSEQLEQQRQYYQQALKALRQGRQKAFRKQLAQLQHYPLKPYLEYASLQPRLHKLPRREVDSFLDRYQGQRIADKLRLQWLRALKNRRRGSDFVHYYKASLADAKLRCYYQYARFRTGNEQQKQDALQQGLKLWNQGKSQPKACDKLFAQLEKQQLIDDKLIWQRYSKALSNRQYKLARYLQKRLKAEPYATWAANASAASKKPHRIGNYAQFADQSPEMLAVIEHNLRRLSREDPQAALKHWRHYRGSHAFKMQAKGHINERIIQGLHKQDQSELADKWLSDTLAETNPTLLEWRIRLALNKAQWTDAQQWLTQLPQEHRNEPRWQYWQARLAQQLNGEDPAPVYAELAQQRSFYGFLANEWLGGSYQMNHMPVSIDETGVEMLETIPAIRRARELYHHGDTLAARREWQYASRNFSEQQWQLSAEMARRWGWSNQAIVSMIQASYWNDIERRFPIDHHSQFAHQSTELDIHKHLLLALARQESALATDAISPVGARGLMQLMPATARQTARKYKIHLANSEQLLEPHKNIELGSRYYRELLDRFNNNRILATAAYNAGPHRVKRWLERSDMQLHFDAWIESIPFKETRNYVQNVLAFSMIYAHLLGSDSRMLDEKEKTALL